MSLFAEHDGFQFYTNDPAFQRSIQAGETEPFGKIINVVKKYLQQYPDRNRTYIDIGAHIGTTIMPYSRLYQNVVGYEANPENYELLVRNVALNQLKNTKVYNFGIFSEECRGDIVQHAGGNSGCFYFVKRENGPILCKRLDDECERKKIENIDYIKIDTEGCELLILQNGMNTILKNKPLIQVEVNTTAMDLFQIENKDTINFLLDLGYRIFDHTDPSNIFLYIP
jgi:FkbM family methyltransferase